MNKERPTGRLDIRDLARALSAEVEQELAQDEHWGAGSVLVFGGHSPQTTRKIEVYGGEGVIRIYGMAFDIVVNRIIHVHTNRLAGSVTFGIARHGEAASLIVHAGGDVIFQART